MFRTWDPSLEHWEDPGGEESRGLEGLVDGCCIRWDTWMICSTRSSGMLPGSRQALERYLQQPRNVTSPGPPQGRCFPAESWFELE